jgi:hypothetical protein
VAGTAESPIVYVDGIDSNDKSAIFAITNGGATITEIWKDGDCSISLPYGYQGYMADVEYFKGADNVPWLLFSGGYQLGTEVGRSLYALQLADNSLAVVDGKKIGANMVGNYFEIDMAPTPEPTTLLLVGTGVLGAFGALRRRRMR